MAIQIPTLSSLSTIHTTLLSLPFSPLTRSLLLSHLLSYFSRLLNALLSRLTDIKFISYAIGLSLFLLAIISFLEIFAMWMFRIIVAAVERVLRDAFRLAEWGLSAVLMGLGVLLVGVAVKGGGEGSEGESGGEEVMEVGEERDGKEGGVPIEDEKGRRENETADGARDERTTSEIGSLEKEVLVVEVESKIVVGHVAKAPASEKGSRKGDKRVKGSRRTR